MTTDKDALKRDRQALESALSDAGAVVRGNAMRCPFHEDNHPSAGIYQREDGSWAFKCHGCGFNGDIFDVQARNAGKRPEDILRALKSDTPKAPQKTVKVFKSLAELEGVRWEGCPIHRSFRYTNPDTGIVDLVVLRFQLPSGAKKFLQCKPQGDGYVMLAPAKPWPLYNRTRLRAAEQVVVVEGEKCVQALQGAGIVATTSPGGAGKALYADWKPLAGKRVVLWPDNDDNGKAHMRDVAAELEKLEPPCQVSILDPDVLSLPPKGDAVEFLELYGDGAPEKGKAAIESALTLAEPVSGSRELRELLEDTISGKRRAVPWPWPQVSNLTRACMPGTITLLCGDPSSTKSFLMLEALWNWHEKGEKVAAKMLEEDRAYHLQRALAQRAGNSKLTDSDWVKENPGEVRAAYAAHGAFLDSFARTIDAAPEAQITLDALAEWVKAKCEAGRRIIVIDPITAAENEDKPWIADQRFVLKANTMVRKHGASLILVTHPKKGKKGSTLEDMAGGAAYSRFSQTVIWVERHDADKSESVQTACGPATVFINRSLKLRKTRNGRGAGLEIGFNFDGQSLRFAEQGVVRKANA